MGPRCHQGTGRPLAYLAADRLDALQLAAWGAGLYLVVCGIVGLARAGFDERSLRIGGVIIAIVGVVWLIEPGAFEPYLGVEPANGTAALVVGFVLVAASFIPPLSVRRPGM